MLTTFSPNWSVEFEQSPVTVIRLSYLVRSFNCGFAYTPHWLQFIPAWLPKMPLLGRNQAGNPLIHEENP